MGLFMTFLSALALVPKPELKRLGNRYVGLSNFSHLAGVSVFNCFLLRSDLGMDMGTPYVLGNFFNFCQHLTPTREISTRKGMVS